MHSMSASRWGRGTGSFRNGAGGIDQVSAGQVEQVSAAIEKVPPTGTRIREDSQPARNRRRPQNHPSHALSPLSGTRHASGQWGRRSRVQHGGLHIGHTLRDALDSRWSRCHARFAHRCTE